MTLSPSSGLTLAGGTRRPRVVQTSCHGCRILPTGADVKAGMAIVPRRIEISAGTVHCGHACPWIGGGMVYIVAISRPVFLDESAGFVGAMGRLLGAGFSRSRQLGAGGS